MFELSLRLWFVPLLQPLVIRIRGIEKRSGGIATFHLNCDRADSVFPDLLSFRLGIFSWTGRERIAANSSPKTINKSAAKIQPDRR